MDQVNFDGGIKFFIFKLSAGLGIGWGLYEKGKKYDCPVENEEIKKQLKSKNHFTASVSLGVSLDFYKY